MAEEGLLIRHSGNQNAWKILEKSIENKRPAHGVLFYGQKGVGKKYMADLYAARLLCTGENKPCLKCKACRTVMEHCHPDVYYAKKTGKLGTIAAGNSMDAEEGTVRDLRSKLFEYPMEGSCKILILSDCKPLGSWIQAQNMLLKVLEEPPEYGYIIFTAEDKNIFIQTILSRIISLPLKTCSDEEVEKILRYKNFDIKEINVALRKCGGNIGRAVSLIADETEKARSEAMENFFSALCFRNPYNMMRSAKIFCADRQSAGEFADRAELIFRDGTALVTGGDTVPLIGESPYAARQLSQNFDLFHLEKFYERVKILRKSLQANLRPDFAVTAFCAELLAV